MSGRSSGAFGRSGRRSGSVKARLRAPHAEQPRQPLARRALRLFGARQVQRGVGVEGLLARPLQLVEVADRLHAPRQFGAGLGGLLHLPPVAHGLLRQPAR